jgi:hypothetical protein
MTALSFSDKSSFHSYSTQRPFSAAVLSAVVSGMDRRDSGVGGGSGGGLDKYSLYQAQPTMALMPSATVTSTSSSIPSTLTQQQQQQPWYARFTEDDWERMQACTLQVLTALGGGENDDENEHDRRMCPDMLAALWIEQEEELFRNQQKHHQQRRSSWQKVLVLPVMCWGNVVTTSACWRILATAATLSLGATATLLLSGSSRRREEPDTANRVET